MSRPSEDIEPIDVSGLSIGTVKYAELKLLFLPQELDDVQDQLKEIEKAGRNNPILVAAYKDFDDFFNAVLRVKAEQAVYNSAIAFATLVELATERLDQLQAESEQESED